MMSFVVLSKIAVCIQVHGVSIIQALGQKEQVLRAADTGICLDTVWGTNWRAQETIKTQLPPRLSQVSWQDSSLFY